MNGPENRPEKSADEKAEETRKQAEAIGKVALDTTKSFMRFFVGLYAKLALGCLIIGILLLVSCVVLLRH